MFRKNSSHKFKIDIYFCFSQEKMNFETKFLNFPNLKQNKNKEKEFLKKIFKKNEKNKKNFKFFREKQK